MKRLPFIGLLLWALFLFVVAVLSALNGQWDNVQILVMLISLTLLAAMLVRS